MLNKLPSGEVLNVNETMSTTTAITSAFQQDSRVHTIEGGRADSLGDCNVVACGTIRCWQTSNPVQHEKRKWSQRIRKRVQSID